MISLKKTGIMLCIVALIIGVIWVFFLSQPSKKEVVDYETNIPVYTSPTLHKPLVEKPQDPASLRLPELAPESPEKTSFEKPSKDKLLEASIPSSFETKPISKIPPATGSKSPEIGSLVPKSSFEKATSFKLPSETAKLSPRLTKAKEEKEELEEELPNNIKAQQTSETFSEAIASVETLPIEKNEKEELQKELPKEMKARQKPETFSEVIAAMETLPIEKENLLPEKTIPRIPENLNSAKVFQNNTSKPKAAILTINLEKCCETASKKQTSSLPFSETPVSAKPFTFGEDNFDAEKDEEKSATGKTFTQLISSGLSAD